MFNSTPLHTTTVFTPAFPIRICVYEHAYVGVSNHLGDDQSCDCAPCQVQGVCVRGGVCFVISKQRKSKVDGVREVSC